MCGNCVDNLRANRAKLRVRPRSGASLPGPRPTAAGLERHAQRFGSEQVVETAAQFGLSVVVERHKRRRPLRRKK